MMHGQKNIKPRTSCSVLPIVK